MTNKTTRKFAAITNGGKVHVGFGNGDGRWYASCGTGENSKLVSRKRSTFHVVDSEVTCLKCQPYIGYLNPDDDPFAPAPEPAPAAAPAHVNNAPVEPEAKFKVGDEVTIGDESTIMRTISDVNRDGFGRVVYRVKKTNGQTGATLYAEDVIHPYIADPRDARISELEARIKELETELADLRGDMERLAAREMELLQQNSVLFHSLDRIAASQEKLQTAARDACAEYGGDMAEDAMHTLADTIGYPWN